AGLTHLFALLRRRVASASLRSVLQDLKQPGRAHSPADARRRDDVFRAATLAFDEDVTGQPGAGDAVGVAGRDCAAVDVQEGVRDPSLVAAVVDLHGVRLVMLPEAYMFE